MKTFSCLSLFTLVCFVFCLMLMGSIAKAQDPELQVTSAEGFDESAITGAPVKVKFRASVDGIGKAGVELMITSSTTIEIQSITNGGVTDALGVVEVEGEVLQANVPIWIQADWLQLTGENLVVRAEVEAIPPPADPTMIVVTKPNKPSLKVGETFTQTIEIKGVDSVEDTDLAAWQISAVYNSAVLKVTAVEPGTFLPESAFAHTPADLTKANGEVTVSQTVLNNAAGEIGGGTLLTLTFEVLEIADELLGVHDVLLLNSKDQKLVYTAMNEGPAIVRDSFAVEDVNRDRLVNVQDLVLVAQSIGKAASTRVDVNGDGFVNIIDLVMVAAKVSPAAPAPAAPLARSNGHINSRTIQEWIQLAQVEDDGSAIFDLGIANLEALLASRIPGETRLLLNYPNPFNPETWIPYQLAEATDVRVMIHSVNGSLIRMLELGHQAAGTYKNKSQAAYWDGRNELGEQVASGLYFYTLTAGDFSATGKMLIRK